MYLIKIFQHIKDTIHSALQAEKYSFTNFHYAKVHYDIFRKVYGRLSIYQQYAKYTPVVSNRNITLVL